MADQKPRCAMYQKGEAWYGDFRGYRRWGGKQEALISDGDHRATKDQVIAHMLFAGRLGHFEDLRLGRKSVQTEPATDTAVPLLSAYVPEHLAELVHDGRLRDYSLRPQQKMLNGIVERIGDVPLDQIGRQHAKRLKKLLQAEGKAPGTVTKYLSALSSVVESAMEEFGLEFNPVRAIKWPAVKIEEAPSLERDECCAMMRAASELAVDPKFKGVRFIDVLIPLFLYTPMRRMEAFRRKVSDVDFEENVIHIQPNEYYPALKSDASTRDVPLWPHLREVLKKHIGELKLDLEARKSGLLFPGKDGQPPTQLRESLNTVFKRAKVEKPEGKAWHLFKHTYATHRLLTTDHGKPIQPFIVMRELGHSDLTMLEKRYGHVLRNRKNSRLEVVEYRPEVAEELLRAAAGR